jgi:hypothetical protein
VVSGNRQKSDISGSLDGFSDVPLMRCTVSGDSARNNLAALRNKKAECTGLFVIDGQVFFCTETAHFTALKRASLAWSTLSAGA